jgi:hypothetical protein
LLLKPHNKNKDQAFSIRWLSEAEYIIIIKDPAITEPAPTATHEEEGDEK